MHIRGPINSNGDSVVDTVPLSDVVLHSVRWISPPPCGFKAATNARAPQLHDGLVVSCLIVFAATAAFSDIISIPAPDAMLREYRNHKNWREEGYDT